MIQVRFSKDDQSTTTLKSKFQNSGTAIPVVVGALGCVGKVSDRLNEGNPIRP